MTLLYGPGITPAYAGTTCQIAVLTLNAQDHPRLRGDHSPTALKQSPTAGSPPLTRGPPTWSHSSSVCLRITPAYAGTTLSQIFWIPILADHPRLRGDHLPLDVNLNHVVGSPPLTRGPRISGVTIDTSYRITPAYAGTTG